MSDNLDIENQSKSNDNMSQFEEKIKMEQEMNEKEQIEKYWINCNSDCRVCAMILNCSHALFQTLKIISPSVPDSSERQINIIYMCFTIVNFVILYLSFKQKYGLQISYYASMCLLFRMPVRWLDFENTRPYESDEEWYSRLVL